MRVGNRERKSRHLLVLIALLCANVCVLGAAPGSDCKPEAEQIANAIEGTDAEASELYNVARCTKNKTCCFKDFQDVLLWRIGPWYVLSL